MSSFLTERRHFPLETCPLTLTQGCFLRALEKPSSRCRASPRQAPPSLTHSGPRLRTRGGPRPGKGAAARSPAAASAAPPSPPPPAEVAERARRAAQPPLAPRRAAPPPRGDGEGESRQKHDAIVWARARSFLFRCLLSLETASSSSSR